MDIKPLTEEQLAEHFDTLKAGDEVSFELFVELFVRLTNAEIRIAELQAAGEKEESRIITFN